MDFNAKLIKIEEPITGEGKNGQWRKQNYVFETESQYPRQICVSVWGDKAISNPAIVQIGNRLNVSFEVESREFNGRWYTDVRAWRIQEAVMGGAQQTGSAPVATANSQPQSFNAGSTDTPTFPAANNNAADTNDDLPF